MSSPAPASHRLNDRIVGPDGAGRCCASIESSQELSGCFRRLHAGGMRLPSSKADVVGSASHTLFAVSRLGRLCHKISVVVHNINAATNARSFELERPMGAQKAEVSAVGLV